MAYSLSPDLNLHKVFAAPWFRSESQPAAVRPPCFDYRPAFAPVAHEGGRVEPQLGFLFQDAVTGVAMFLEDRLDVAQVINRLRGREAVRHEQQAGEQWEGRPHGGSAAGD